MRLKISSLIAVKKDFQKKKHRNIIKESLFWGVKKSRSCLMPEGSILYIWRRRGWFNLKGLTRDYLKPLEQLTEWCLEVAWVVRQRFEYFSRCNEYNFTCTVSICTHEKLATSRQEDIKIRSHKSYWVRPRSWPLYLPLHFEQYPSLVLRPFAVVGCDVVDG